MLKDHTVSILENNIHHFFLGHISEFWCLQYVQQVIQVNHLILLYTSTKKKSLHISFLVVSWSMFNLGGKLWVHYREVMKMKWNWKLKQIVLFDVCVCRLMNLFAYGSFLSQDCTSMLLYVHNIATYSSCWWPVLWDQFLAICIPSVVHVHFWRYCHLFNNTHPSRRCI